METRQYTVTVKFTRNNPDTGYREDGERTGDVEAGSVEEALNTFIGRCAENESGNEIIVTSSEAVIKF